MEGEREGREEGGTKREGGGVEEKEAQWQCGLLPPCEATLALTPLLTSFSRNSNCAVLRRSTKNCRGS